MKTAHLCTMVCTMLAIGAGACEPRFQGSGKLTIDGAVFVPTTCHRSSCGVGIELGDAAGARLQLVLPPQVLDAWSELSGQSEVKLQKSPGESMSELGTCGTLTMRGEGYHDQRGRAASGHVTVACASPTAVQGEYKFRGCL
jgi:hypothetical protein